MIATLTVISAVAFSTDPAFAVKGFGYTDVPVQRMKTTRKIYDVNGEEIYRADGYGRQKADINDLPEYTLNAFIAIEDARYYSHDGFDAKRIAAAAVKDILSFSAKEGASTITQQLVKNVWLSPEKTLSRKIKELSYARMLEKTLTKKEILGMYLNSLYFGDGVYGIADAAERFFDKAANELGVGESAMLAAVINNPAAYNPYRHNTAAEKRKRLVLSEMLRHGFITENEMKEALSDFRNFVTEKMPYAMDILAKGFYMIFRLGKAGSYVIKTLAETLFYLFDRIPGKAKLAGVGILGFLTMLKLGPLGLFIAALTTLLLLVEDYMSWKEGKKAYLSSTWEKLDEAFSNEDSSLNKVKDTFLFIFDTATDILELVTDVTGEIVEWNKETEALSMLFEGILDFVNQIATAVNGITSYWGFLRDKDKLMEEYKSGNITKDEYAKQRESLESGFWGGIIDFWKNIFKIDEETKSKIDSKLPSWLPGNANQTAAKTTAGMLPAKTNNIKYNQTTNVSVTQSPYESAESTGMKVANKISSIRPWGTVFV